MAIPYGADVIVTEVSYFGRKTVIWRGTFGYQHDTCFTIMFEGRELVFDNNVSVRTVGYENG